MIRNIVNARLCPTCDGIGEKINPEWLRYWDGLGPLPEEGAPKDVKCDNCHGRGYLLTHSGPHEPPEEAITAK